MTEETVVEKQVGQFMVPKREIFNIFDINKWYKSEAYLEFLNFIRRLSRSVRSLPTTSEIEVNEYGQKLISFLDTLESWIAEFPPVDMGSQRYGNKAYAKWHEKLTAQLDTLIPELLNSKSKEAAVELKPYLVDSFGNATRVDYGSGHEAAFLTFLLCLYKLDHLKDPDDNQAAVLRVFHRYLKLVRKLQIDYRMEPAGSRGVHALDDFQFCPFIFGSSQLINNRSRLTPDDYLKEDQVLIYQFDNLFFEAIQFINDNKTGPFYEHSNQLYNISGVPNWEKINSGMFKMYEGEVLKKFPVVQHFLFGSLFRIQERDDALSTSSAKEQKALDESTETPKPLHLEAIPE
ncbi:Serine/threonine-protein phosphatase 2A activator [Aphelenchoides bicaudatus]|nr:Serine/threonine-protein phosphatase 2A activator [Aphelenchoides bicaudatus]